MFPLSTDEVRTGLLRVGVRVLVRLSAAIATWLTANTVLPGWLAEEAASWLVVGLVVGVLLVEHYARRLYRRRTDGNTTSE